MTHLQCDFFNLKNLIVIYPAEDKPEDDRFLCAIRWVSLGSLWNWESMMMWFNLITLGRL